MVNEEAAVHRCSGNLQAPHCNGTPKSPPAPPGPGEHECTQEREAQNTQVRSPSFPGRQYSRQVPSEVKMSMASQTNVHLGTHGSPTVNGTQMVEVSVVRQAVRSEVAQAVASAPIQERVRRQNACVVPLGRMKR